MPIRIGDKNISKVMYGDSEVSKIYYGDEFIYPVEPKSETEIKLTGGNRALLFPRGYEIKPYDVGYSYFVLPDEYTNRDLYLHGYDVNFEQKGWGEWLTEFENKSIQTDVEYKVGIYYKWDKVLKGHISVYMFLTTGDLSSDYQMVGTLKINANHEIYDFKQYDPEQESGGGITYKFADYSVLYTQVQFITDFYNPNGYGKSVPEDTWSNQTEDTDTVNIDLNWQGIKATLHLNKKDPTASTYDVSAKGMHLPLNNLPNLWILNKTNTLSSNARIYCINIDDNTIGIIPCTSPPM